MPPFLAANSQDQSALSPRLHQSEHAAAFQKPFSTQAYEQKVKAHVAGDTRFLSPEQLLTQAWTAHGRKVTTAAQVNSADLRQRSVNAQSMVRLQAELYAKSVPDELLMLDDGDDEDGNADVHAHQSPASRRPAAAAAPTAGAAAVAAGGSAQRLARLGRASTTAVPGAPLKSAMKGAGGARAHAAPDKPPQHAIAAQTGTEFSDDEEADDGVPAIVMIHGDSYGTDDDDDSGDSAADEARAAAVRAQCAAASVLGPSPAPPAAASAADAQQAGRAENLISQLRTFQRGAAGPSYLGGGVEASVRAGSVSLPQGCSFLDGARPTTGRPSRLAPTGAASGSNPATPPHMSPVMHRIGDFRPPTSPLSPGAASGSAPSGASMTPFPGARTDASMRLGRGVYGGTSTTPVSPPDGSVRPARVGGSAAASPGLTEMAARSVRAGPAQHPAGAEEGGHGAAHRHGGAEKSVHGGGGGGGGGGNWSGPGSPGAAGGLPAGTVRVADPGALRRRAGSSAADPSVRPGLGTRLSVTTGSTDYEPGQGAFSDVAQSPISPAPATAVSLFKAITGSQPVGRALPLPAEGVEYSGKSVRGGSVFQGGNQNGAYSSAPVGDSVLGGRFSHASAIQVEMSSPSCLEPRTSCPSSMRLPRIGSSLMMAGLPGGINHKGQYGGSLSYAATTGALVDSHAGTGRGDPAGMMSKVKGLFGLLKR